MSKYSGYMGKVMMMDLTTGEVEEYPWTDRDRELYIGGKAMGSKIMFDTFHGTEDPLGPKNIIVITTGPLTGVGAPCSNRFNISTLSPQSGLTTSSNCGGNFGYYLKKAGYDALILKGQCPELSWLEIHNDKFTLHSAEELKGLRVGPAQEKLQEWMDESQGCRAKCGMVSIGPAGENKVLYACVISGERAAGRAGVGAVFGSKNLKAIVASGNHEVKIHDPEKTRKFHQKWVNTLREHPLTGNQLPKMGTAGLVTTMQARGILADAGGRF